LVLTLCNCNYPLHVILVDPIQLQMVSCRRCNMPFTWFFTQCLKKPTMLLWGSSDIFFPNFLMLHLYIESEEGFSMK
jgi:hypothetical protein